MADTFIWKTDRPWPNPRLRTAAIIGHTTATTARLWFRTASKGTFTALLYPLSIRNAARLFAGFKAVPYNDLATLPATVKKFEFEISGYDKDTTHVLDLDQLQPLTEYGYALFGNDNGVDRIMLGQDRQHSFRTLPDKKKPMSFGFYSCHMPYKQTVFGNTNLVNIEMWDCFAEVLSRHHKKDLRFVIAGGDQVYSDGVESLNIWAYLNKVARKENGKLLPEKDAMVSWYRDIYRGYWGFQRLKEVFANYPTYMIWDDHELGDGWGSHRLTGKKDDELDEILPDWKKRGLSYKDGLILLEQMEEAAKQVYCEYQHDHNPPTPKDTYDYEVSVDNTALYFLDGRGYRDINRRTRRILGTSQFNRFKNWLQALTPAKTKYLFIVSAVPVVHLNSVLANADNNTLSDLAGLQDDLRDGWEHQLHDSERKALLRALFDTANKGIRICVLSGDVHTSAAFRLTDDQTGSIVYQLTSSAITYNKPRILGWVLGKAVADEGHSKDGYSFERLALYTDSNFSMIKVDPETDKVVFQLYGKQTVSDPNEEQPDLPMTHAIAKLELNFS